MGDVSVDATQERMRELGGLLSRVAEDPDAVRELGASFAERDPRRFRDVLDRTLGGFELPGDKCDPYVRVFIEILEPPEFVRVCTWVAQATKIDHAESNAIVEALPASDALLAALERAGLVKCEWVRKERSTILEVNKFVQGICPPGTF
jgi:hypothetical protein